MNVRAGPRVCQASYLFRLVNRLGPVLAFLSSLLGLPSPAVQAQGLPAYSPINPVAESRTALGFEPYRTPRPGGWSLGLSLDYGSAIELAPRAARRTIRSTPSSSGFAFASPGT